MTRNFFLDESRYESLIKAIGSLSGLFGDGVNANIHYRTVERLFIYTTKAKDLTRKDKVFDALVGKSFEIGVGIKTFALQNKGVKSKMEKVQELTRIAGSGHLDRLPPEKLVRRVSEIRNKSIRSDSNQFGVDISKSIYHCLVRLGDAAYIHEQPYPLIDLENLLPANSRGKVLRRWNKAKSRSTIHFFDGKHHYSYHTSKNTLSMRFEFPNLLHARRLDMTRIPDIWDVLDSGQFFSALTDQPPKITGKPLKKSTSMGKPGVDYVVLPLYTLRNEGKKVEKKSGINFWNAGGRKRKYGEAYIPVPKAVHDAAPGFFPRVGNYFLVQLPDRTSPVRASLCQENGKALMSEKNNELCQWLYKVLDPYISEDAFKLPPKRKPFEYNDLVEIGSDCIVVTKIQSSPSATFSIELGALGDYEEFLSGKRN